MRSAQVCRIMLAVSLTFTLFQPLRAAAQGSPSPTYTLPPKDRAFSCTVVGEVVGPCDFAWYDPKPQVHYPCSEKGPLENYTKDREDRIGKLQGELLSLAQDEGVQRRTMQQAQYDIDLATKNANYETLRAAQKASADAETNLRRDKVDSAWKLNEIKALRDEMDKTAASYKQTVDSNAGKCQCYVVDERTGKCKCTKERYDRAVREGNNAKVCGGGQSR